MNLLTWKITKISEYVLMEQRWSIFSGKQGSVVDKNVPVSGDCQNYSASLAKLSSKLLAASNITFHHSISPAKRVINLLYGCQDSLINKQKLDVAGWDSLGDSSLCWSRFYFYNCKSWYVGKRFMTLHVVHMKGQKGNPCLLMSSRITKLESN